MMFLNLLEMKKWNWAPDGVESGRVFLTTLTIFLWYLDGYHDTLYISPGIQSTWIVLTISMVQGTANLKASKEPKSKFQLWEVS